MTENESDTVISAAHLHKVLHTGSKSFWRTRETVDVRIIEHTDVNILEIIGFEVESYQEADRLYINAEKLYKKLETPELVEKVNQKREEFARQRKRVPNAEITRTLLQEAAVQYIIARLVTATTKNPPKQRGSTSNYTASDCASSLTSAEATDTTTEASSATSSSTDESAACKQLAEPRFAIDLACLTGDRHGPGPDKRLDVLLECEPEGLEHIIVTRPRKKASNKEFHAVMRQLRQDSDMLNKATSDAQRKAGLAVSSVDGFKNFAMKRKYDPNTMTLPQWRWIWAGRRIILQNYVKAVHLRLERYERERNNAALNAEELVPGALDAEPDDVKSRRMKQSHSGTSVTRLPSLMTNKTRHSMSSLRRISRGSREARPLDEFSAAFSGAVKKHSDLHLNGFVCKETQQLNTSSSLPAI